MYTIQVHSFIVSEDSNIRRYQTMLYLISDTCFYVTKLMQIFLYDYVERKNSSKSVIESIW